MSGGEATRGAKPEPHMDMYIFKKISADCEFVLHILLFFRWPSCAFTQYFCCQPM